MGSIQGSGRKEKVDLIDKEADIFECLNPQNIHLMAKALTEPYEVLRLVCTGQSERFEFLMGVLPNVYEEQPLTPREEAELRRRIEYLKSVQRKNLKALAAR